MYVYIIIIITTLILHRYPPSLMFMTHGHYYPCHRASYIIPRTISPPWGVCSPCCQMCSAQRAESNTITISALTGPHLYSRVKRSHYSLCLAQGHKHRGRGQDTNPRSDDSAIRIQVWDTSLSVLLSLF